MDYKFPQMSFKEEEIVKAIFKEQQQKEEELTDLELKNAEKIYLEFYQTAIATLEKFEYDMEKFIELISEAGCIILLQQPICPKYTKKTIQKLMKDYNDENSKLILMSHMMNICSILQEFTILPVESRQELAIACLEELIENKESPFFKESTKQIAGFIQINSLLSTHYLQRVTGKKEENYKNSLKYNLEAYFKLDESKDVDQWCSIVNNQIIIYRKLQKYEESISSAKKLLKVRNIEQKPIEYSLTCINIGNIYVDENFIKKVKDPKLNFEEAMNYYTNALKPLDKQKNTIQWSIATMSIAYVLFLSSNEPKNLLKAIDLLNESLSVTKRESRKSDYGTMNFHKTNVYWKLYVIEKKVDYLKEALKSVNESISVMTVSNETVDLKKKVIEDELKKYEKQ